MSITLSELISKQTELQGFLPSLPNYQQLHCAQLDEIGEINHACKWAIIESNGDKRFDGWSWWKRASMEPTTREHLISEFLDLLHFTLLEVILDGFTYKNIVDDGEYELMWDFSPPKFGVEQAYDYFAKYLDAFCGGMCKLKFLVRAAIALGVTREELESNFQASYQKNVDRWTSENV